MRWTGRAIASAGVAVAAAILPAGAAAHAATGGEDAATDQIGSAADLTPASSRKQAGPYSDKVDCDEMRGRLASIGYSTTPCWFNTITLGWHFEYWK
jgi:hypothetical protein